MQLEIIPDDLHILPMIGPGGLTREKALAEVQSILDRAATLAPDLREASALWKRGAKDDTVYSGPFTWTVYEYADGEDPRAGALAWIEGYAQTMRDAGLDISIPRLPGA
jgi:hypothetical protein